MSRHALVVGAGVIGLSSAYHLRRRGFEVTVLERDRTGHAVASYGNAGIVVPSHFVPLAAPGVIGQALKWMLDPGSPFSVRPRPSLDLVRWCCAGASGAAPPATTCAVRDRCSSRSTLPAAGSTPNS